MLTETEWQKLDVDPFGELGKTRTEFEQELMEVKEIVEIVLTKYPTTRNNDDWLRRQVWKDFGEKVNGSTVDRERRIIQLQEHRLLPTDPKVFWRSLFSQSTIE